MFSETWSLFLEELYAVSTENSAARNLRQKQGVPELHPRLVRQ
jgi:hypothetical protein